MSSRLTSLLLALMLGSIVCTSVCAQRLSVESFIETNDQDAVLPGIKEIDPSDGKTPMALIKVQTTERGFIFETRLGNCKVVQKVGEFWVYVPRDIPRLNIRHPRYGNSGDYDLPTGPTRSGTTYRMTLRISGGRHVDISSNPSGADLFIDGESIGKTPVRNLFLGNGQRHLQARAMRDRFEIDTTLTITEGNLMNVDLQLHDITPLLGRVEVSAADNAEIIFRGQKCGDGSWYTDELREGTYELQTIRPDCDTAYTTFRVERGKLNRVTANPPIPHTGYLNLFMRTKGVTFTETNNKTYDPEQTLVPVGHYHFIFSRKGYYSEEHEYDVRRGEAVNDTIHLSTINYVKKTAIYFGAAFTVSSLSGITGILGVVYKRHDLQANYTLGLMKSKQTNWSSSDGNFLGSANHKINSFGFKYGYQIPIVKQLALTPQVGYACNIISSTKVSGSKSYANGAMANYVTIGAKVIYAPIQHGYLFVAPEYDIAFKKDQSYNAAAAKAGFQVSGFVLHAGILVNF